MKGWDAINYTSNGCLCITHRKCYYHWRTQCPKCKRTAKKGHKLVPLELRELIKISTMDERKICVQCYNKVKQVFTKTPVVNDDQRASENELLGQLHESKSNKDHMDEINILKNEKRQLMEMVQSLEDSQYMLRNWLMDEFHENNLLKQDSLTLTAQKLELTTNMQLMENEIKILYTKFNTYTQE